MINYNKIRKITQKEIDVMLLSGKTTFKNVEFDRLNINYRNDKPLELIDCKCSKTTITAQNERAEEGENPDIIFRGEMDFYNTEIDGTVRYEIADDGDALIKARVCTFEHGIYFNTDVKYAKILDSVIRGEAIFGLGAKWANIEETIITDRVGRNARLAFMKKSGQVYISDSEIINYLHNNNESDLFVDKADFMRVENSTFPSVNAYEVEFAGMRGVSSGDIRFENYNLDENIIGNESKNRSVGLINLKDCTFVNLNVSSVESVRLNNCKIYNRFKVEGKQNKVNVEKTGIKSFEIAEQENDVRVQDSNISKYVALWSDQKTQGLQDLGLKVEHGTLSSKCGTISKMIEKGKSKTEKSSRQDDKIK